MLFHPTSKMVHVTIFQYNFLGLPLVLLYTVKIKEHYYSFASSCEEVGPQTQSDFHFIKRQNIPFTAYDLDDFVVRFSATEINFGDLERKDVTSQKHKNTILHFFSQALSKAGKDRDQSFTMTSSFSDAFMNLVLTKEVIEKIFYLLGGNDGHYKNDYSYDHSHHCVEKEDNETLYSESDDESSVWGSEDDKDGSLCDESDESDESDEE
jgi:hypothetical protein